MYLFVWGIHPLHGVVPGIKSVLSRSAGRDAFTCLSCPVGKYFKFKAFTSPHLPSVFIPLSCHSE